MFSNVLQSVDCVGSSASLEGIGRKCASIGAVRAVLKLFSFSAVLLTVHVFLRP